jgi:hypothetical protein
MNRASRIIRLAMPGAATVLPLLPPVVATERTLFKPIAGEAS